MELLKAGLRTSDVAKRLKCRPCSVRKWRRAYAKAGAEALRAKPPPGRPAKLSHRHKMDLRKRLLRGARSNGFSTDLWTCRRIVQVIKRRYGVVYHVDSMPRFLAGLGFSCQKPQKRAVERDEEAIARWVARDWPRIKKTLHATEPT